MTKTITDIEKLNEEIQAKSTFVELIKIEMKKNIIGQQNMIDKLLIALLSDGHILLEGVPGLAKTLAIKSLSEVIDVDFKRIQFTPDLLPADLLGTMIYSPKTESFSVKKGPLFSNFILADEINRAPAKVQAALLESMQERQITLGDKTYKLDEPFLVMATENPIEQEGTYPLPEAQVDRFLLKVVLDYPSREEEKQIIQMNIGNEKKVKIKKILTPTKIMDARNSVNKIYMDEKIEQYIVDIVYATRKPEEYKLESLQDLISIGASPRASISLALASKSYAFLKKRGYIIPEDVRAVCKDVLRHRIGLTYEAEAENISQEEVITKILNQIEVP